VLGNISFNPSLVRLEAAALMARAARQSGQFQSQSGAIRGGALNRKGYGKIGRFQSQSGAIRGARVEAEAGRVFLRFNPSLVRLEARESSHVTPPALLFQSQSGAIRGLTESAG